MKTKSNTSNEKLSVKSHEKWFDQVPKITSQKESHPEDIVLALSAEARNILDSETRLYNQMKEVHKDKDHLWVKRILHSGTLADKVSAHTILVQDSPVYNAASIETLVGMVNTKGKRECLMAMDTLQDLFLNHLLAEDRKLRQFNEQPLQDLDTLSKKTPQLRRRILILWWFEDVVKSLYRTFVTHLSAVSHDTIEKTKQRAVSVMCHLLKEHPEQEQFLLEQVVNKIGDPVAKVGSHVCYLLGHLLGQHPDMKSVVVQEVERLVFRPNLSDRAKYYALCFLNQVILCQGDFDLANHLIMMYFAQFKLFVKKGEVQGKMMSALLTGVARAYPYAKLKENVLMEQLDAMYRLVHMVAFNVGIQALMLIFQVLDSNDSVSDRFYCALYRKLFDPALGTSSRQASLLNLVYRALKKDVASVRVKAFVKRLLQIALYQAPNLQCGILVLLSEVSKLHPSILEARQSFERDSDSEERYEDAPDDGHPNNEDAIEPPKEIKKEPGSSWFHRQSARRRSRSSYDTRCRNPLHAGAEFSNVWELVLLRRCFHPSVALFAHQMSNAKEIKYSGDPLLDFTTARFLDRFVYRNPKKQSEQQSVHSRVFGGRKLKAKAPLLVPINSSEYIQQNSKNVPPEEQFIYRYLRGRAEGRKKSKREDEDLESVTSEDFQRLLDDIHPEDEGKDSLDFAKELGLHKKKRKAESESEESDLSDEEAEFEDEEDFEGMDDIDDDVCEDDFVALDTGSQKKSGKRRKVESLTDPSLMASADEFSTLLEDNAGSQVDTLTEQAFANKDKAGAKQIAWEVQRDRFVKGKKWSRKRQFNKRRS